MSRINSATSGANNMGGLVEGVADPGASEVSGMSLAGDNGGAGGAALAPYPHEQNGSVGGSFPGPVTQPPQNLGNV